MNLELYQQQTLKLCRKYEGILTTLSVRQSEGELNDIEQQGLLHALQVLVENAIGKSKHLLKQKNLDVPVSAYDAFELLANKELITAEEQKKWKKAIGLRNVIVHEYMSINMEIPYSVLKNKDYKLILDFLRKPFDEF